MQHMMQVCLHKDDFEYKRLSALQQLCWQPVEISERPW